jgi:hypothetical protein
VAVGGPVLGVAQPGTLVVTALPNTGTGDETSRAGRDAAATGLILGAATAIGGAALVRQRQATSDSDRGNSADT